MHSIMNDENLKNFGAILISEPHVWRNNEGRVISTPAAHYNWTKIEPTATCTEGRWAYRSMIWTRIDLEAEQIQVESSDITAVIIRLSGHIILLFSVYVQGSDPEALLLATQKISQVISSERSRINTLQVVVAGDFNRQDILWGGEAVSDERQGEAEPIIEMMGEQGLVSLLKRGTITRSQGGNESTIDLTLTTQGLANSMSFCKIHDIDHGSDHLAVESRFNLEVPAQRQTQRFLFKEASWQQIREIASRLLESSPSLTDTQGRCNHLMDIVSQAVQAHTPKAKPSPYSKRWWNKELTVLRTAQSHLRNAVRRLRSEGIRDIALEQSSTAATKRYHSAIRHQKKQHWVEFVAAQDNIWKVAKFLDLDGLSSFAMVPPLIRADRSITEGEEQKAQELLGSFYPPLPDAITEEPITVTVTAVEDPDITMEEIKRKVFSAKPWKAPGRDGLPSIVWQQLWPVIKEEMLGLFRASLDDGILPSQWREAKIIPLKKPNKPDYRLARAWRPISLLATLGKIFEAILAERISYVAEKYNLLPENHFGARRRRSAEQALILLQESIYKSWRGRQMLSLISFDVKGA